MCAREFVFVAGGMRRMGKGGGVFMRVFCASVNC